MAKKVYTESVKKWAKNAGIGGGTLIGLIFVYLLAVGAISDVSYSGDIVCAGTIEDPCYAFINFTAEEDIFLYPTGYDPWGRESIFNFDPNVKSWKLERSWGKGWREINMSTNCKATWCGASDSSGNTKYSVAFRDGKSYRLRITAYKNDPTEDIKWGAFSGVDEIDPTWQGIGKENIINDKKYILSLRSKNSKTIKEVSGNLLTKEFFSENKRLWIYDSEGNTKIDMKLLSDYSETVKSGSGTKVAEFLLIDWSIDSSFFDTTEFYNIKDKYSKVSKSFVFKYATEVEEEICTEVFLNNTKKLAELELSSLKSCEDMQVIKWTSFDSLEDLPNKNIVVGIFTDTFSGEEVEWVPTINGFNVFEYASYLVTDLVSYYKLDESSGVVIDSHGSNNGTNSGGTPGVAGKSGTAYNFDGVGQDRISTFTTPVEGIISIWVYLDEFPTLDSELYFFYNSGSSNWNIMRLGHNGFGNPYYGFYDAGNHEFLNDTINLSTSQWYHIAASFGSEGLKLYVDGVLSGSDATYTGNGDGNQPMYIGSITTQNDVFNGTIDEVGFWDAQLPQSNITDLYNGGLGKFYPFEDLFVDLVSPADSFYNPDLGALNFTCNAYSLNLSNVTFYTNISGSFVANGTNTSSAIGDYVFERNIEDYDDFIWNCYACDIWNNCTFADSNWTIDMVELTLDITSPTTSSPESVSEGDNISVNFNFQEDGINLTSGVSIESVFIGTSEATIISVGTPVEVSVIDFEPFDADVGGWTQATFDTDDWTWRGTAPSDSSGTGPNELYDGGYMYTETSSGSCNSPDTAVLYLSPEIDFDSYSSVNLSMAYNMIGSTMGTLHIKENSTGSWVSVWSKTGDQGSAWLTANQNITGLTASGNIAIWMDCGASYTSDAAIDSVNVTGTTGGISEEFEYIAGIGWQVNVTVPTGLTGSQDLFVNATYLGYTRNETESNAINYSDIEDTCTCPGLNEDWEVNMSDYCILTSSCDLGTGKLSFVGSGNFSCSEELITSDMGDPGNGNTIYINNACIIRVQ